jgi:hypothetical protein
MRRALFLALLLIPLACGDDHPSRPPAVDPPELGSISLSDFAVVGDTLAVSVEADRADTLLLLVDDAVVAAATEAPFTFRVSTVAFANGLRWMSARAVNAGGEDEQLVPFLLDRLHGGVAVVVLPLSVKIDVGASEQFTARVLGTPVKQVIWSVAQDALVPYPGVDVGTIDISGVYTAPPEFAPGLVVMVRASSAIEPAAHGEAHVELQPAVAIEIVSSPAEIVTGRAYDFGARIYGTTDGRLTWSVVGGDDRGTISFDGHYVAPTALPSPPTVTIAVRSAGFPEKQTQVTIPVRWEYVVSVNPDSVAVAAGHPRQFNASVIHAEDTRVRWSVAGNPPLGSISTEGVYTPPPPHALAHPSEARVVARCVADTSRTGESHVMLLPTVTVRITSAPTEILTDRTYAFAAAVDGIEDQRVDWTVIEGFNFGAIDGDGRYTAPEALPNPARVTIRAVSRVDPRGSADVILTMRRNIQVAIAPETATVSAGGVKQFAATLEHAALPGVVWSVVGGNAFGSIDASGRYAAPGTLPVPPQAVVRAQSVADTSRKAEAVVTLVPAPPGDEPPVLAYLAGTGRTVMRMSNQLAGLAIKAALTATYLNGGVHTLTGKLVEYRQTYSYTPETGDWLTVVPETGPSWKIRYASLQPTDAWFWGAWNWITEGYEFNGELDCILASKGFEMRVINSSRAADDWQKAANVCYGTEFERTLIGKFLLSNGDALACDLLHKGKTTYCSLGTFTDEAVIGTAAIGYLNLALNERYEMSISGSWEQPPEVGSKNWTWRQNSTGTYRGREYAAQGVRVSGAYYLPGPYSNGWAFHPEYWVAAGTLQKNGAAYGGMMFTGPVVEGAAGPEAVLEYGFGHRLVAKPPGITDWTERELADPFR